MAITTNAICNSFKKELQDGDFDFSSDTAQVFKVPEKLTIESWAASSANLFAAGLKGIFVILLISFTIFLSKPFLVFRPVPTAVPPWAK